MKKLTLLLSLLVLSSCSTYLKTTGPRMLSPESHGGLGHGSIDLARLQGSKQYQMDFRQNTTKVPMHDDAVTYGVGVSGEVGFFKYLDVYLIPSLTMSPTLFGAKYQILGDTRQSAKKGNFSLSINAAVGGTGEERKDADNDSDIFDGGVDKIEYGMGQSEAGIIAGYRWADSLLHYANFIRYGQNVSGKVTNNAGTLVDENFDYQNRGVIVSTGFIFYHKKLQLKADYTYLTTDWNYNKKDTANILNAAVGFNW